MDESYDLMGFPSFEARDKFFHELRLLGEQGDWKAARRLQHREFERRDPNFPKFTDDWFN